MKTRVKVIFPANRPGKPGWPYVNYNVFEKSKQVLADLRDQLPEIEFSSSILYSTEEAEELIQEEKGEFDGYLVYMTANPTRIEQVFARKAAPVIIADDPYAGSGRILLANSIVQRENLPVVAIASSRFRDVVEAVRLFDVMQKLREAKILVLTRRETPPKEGKILEPFGTSLLPVDVEELEKRYREADHGQAREVASRWMAEAKDIVEPDEQEIMKSARLFVGIKEIMEGKKADAITIDCLGLYYSHSLPAYPCLSFFELNNQGSTGVCEADLRSTLCQLLFRYLTGRPAYVSDPVIDTGTDRIIYAHCVATNRVFGPEGQRNPYLIRSHSEDQKGASVESLMPLGEVVTTIQVNPQKNAFSIHTGKTVANVHEEKACRTKLAAEVESEAIFDNYNFDIFGWHRVTCYGDHRKACINLAKLYGFKINEEDKRQRKKEV